MKCPTCGKEMGTFHRCAPILMTAGADTKYMQVIRDCTPAEICQHYEKIIKEMDVEIEGLNVEMGRIKEIIKMIKDKHSVEHRHRHNEFPSTTSLCEEALASLGKKEE